MVTGDQHAIAVETSRRLGLGTDIMEGAELLQGQPDGALGDKVNLVDGFAGVYPEHKYAIVEAYQSHGRLVGMTGDGVNDAPALKRANVGIAVAGATSAAKAAADIILTEEGIGTIVTALIRSRKIFRRLETYIVYRMASSIAILVRLAGSGCSLVPFQQCTGCPAGYDATASRHGLVAHKLYAALGPNR
jgi:H+-transporting ATPase